MSLECFTVYSSELGTNKKVRVYLPLNYNGEHAGYPVIYMHDGQNLFEKETSAFGEIWDVHTAIESYIHDGGVGAIVVGIDNSPGLERFNEYSPFYSDSFNVLKCFEGIDNKRVGGKGDLYGKFLVETLKPLIDLKYRTLKEPCNTIVAGSSMGGYISLYLACSYPNIFGKAGVFSPAMWFAESEMLNYIKISKLTPGSKWYVDIGTNETSNSNIPDFPEIYVKGDEIVANLLQSKHTHLENVLFIKDENAIHNEKYWAKRFPFAIKLLLS